jgi:hypothetical protein
MTIFDRIVTKPFDRVSDSAIVKALRGLVR